MSGEKVFALDELEPGSAKKVVLAGIPIAVVRDSAGAEGADAVTDADSSSSSILACRRSWSAGEPICWTISARKPRTTRRRASSSGIPRDWR